ncbi:MAG TPA: lipase maturation factor family protein [Candidatus Acidoferrales bacterium]|nr:lipase maturation factor family protein [Candidatus Acidoferrales bacterium]
MSSLVISRAPILPGDVLTRRFFLSALAIVYGVAFVSLWVQVDGLIGSQGILPAQQLIDAGAQLGKERWLRLPTLAWFVGASDPVLHGACALGTALSVLLMIGIAPMWTAAGAWLLYLSLYTICRDFLGFQWDILLLEAGFLAIFYAPPWVLSPGSKAWSAEPARPILWLLRLLVAKLMFLSGVVKLSGGDSTWRNLTALTYHYETTCLPTWTGWYMHQMPLWFHQISAVGMFVVELIAPLGVFGPRPLRLFAAVAFTALMLFIGATGNYGFFNLLAIVLCLPLLDDRIFSRLLRPLTRRLPESRSRPFGTKPSRGWPLLLTVPLAGILVVLNTVPLARALRLAIPWPTPIVRLYQLQAPLQIVNSYGLFARMTTERPEIIVEGSDDGQNWKAYEFRWKPGDVKRRPRFVQPHMPRLDWQMWFAALGSYETSRWFLPFCVRLLQGSRPVLDLLQSNPFADRPPRYLRATLYDYRFTDREQRRSTGAWWRRQRLRAYIPVLELGADGALRKADLDDQPD